MRRQLPVLRFFAGFCAAAILTLAIAPRADAESVQFNYRLPQVGEKSSQVAQYDLDLTRSMQQTGKTLSSEKRLLLRTIHRRATVLDVAGDRPLKAAVTYAKASEVITSGEQPPESRKLPIEGNTYLVERQGVALKVTDRDDKSVPEAERVMVAANMDSIGHRNQLGRFLHGKTVEVGETLQLPKEMAADLLGMREAKGDAQKVELTLSGTATEAGRRIAKFAAAIAVKMGSGSALDMKGAMQIDIETCRILAADFSGSISSQEGQSDNGQEVQVLTDGTLKVAVKSDLVR
jgi:hypothetical protein